MNIDKCPVKDCGESIQLTIEVWYADSTVKVNEHGSLTVVDRGYVDDENEQGIRIYCAADHTEEQMLAAVLATV